MAKGRFSGAKYANGNHKAQQKAYNKTKKGKALIRNAQSLRASLKIPKGSAYDAAHYKGSKTKGRKQHRSINRASRTKSA
jgi:hypothetical protein